jgi:hypothetical protein
MALVVGGCAETRAPKLVKVLLYRDTNTFAAVYKSLTVFCK